MVGQRRTSRHLDVQRTFGTEAALDLKLLWQTSLLQGFVCGVSRPHRVGLDCERPSVHGAVPNLVVAPALTNTATTRLQETADHGSFVVRHDYDGKKYCSRFKEDVFSMKPAVASIIAGLIEDLMRVQELRDVVDFRGRRTASASLNHNCRDG